jgi:hypothetical protein
MPRETQKSPSRATLSWLAVAFLAGGFLRLYFLSSHGTWDTEYRKAWANETVVSGITHAYGGPESIPEGEFLKQLTGEKPRFEVLFRDRYYVIDYPPLALAAWGESWRFFTSRPRPYRGAEAENLAVKFPAVLGDVLSVIVLLWAFRGAPRIALSLASLYWIFPITWVSSAVHGNFDGAVPPFLLASLFVAGASPLAAGALFAVSCLIKPTVAVVIPVLFMAASKAAWRRVITGGVLVTVLVFTPYALSRTLQTAIVHVGRLFSQERISGGYANPWWILGHAASVRWGKAEWGDPVDYVRRDAFNWPLGLMGFIVAGLCAAWILYAARKIRTPASAAYVSALLLLVWGICTVGVHDNHNHPLFLLLVGTGLKNRFLKSFSALAATSTVLGSLCLHGLGRFYGRQWREVLPIADAVARMRMAAGFDLTLVLAVVNTVLLAIALLRLKRTLEELEGQCPAS